jgi:NAD(P)-dependent dehydrogenase (short-subunit alcohol dehydrogenase family)
MSSQFEGHNALVTGGGTGIGRAAAIALAAEGATVTVAGRTETTLEETVRLVRDARGSARLAVADVHDEDAVRHAVQVAGGDEGRLDMAVNSAGIDGGNDAHPTVDYPSATVALMLATNVQGMFFSMKHELALMVAHGAGSIRDRVAVLATLQLRHRRRVADRRRIHGPLTPDLINRERHV